MLFTASILVAIAFIWWLVNRATEPISGTLTARRKRSSWVWALVGAGLGSFVGIAVFGMAIAGTIPGAVLGYFAADYLMLRRNGNSNPDVYRYIQPLFREGELERASVVVSRGFAALFQFAFNLLIFAIVVFAVLAFFKTDIEGFFNPKTPAASTVQLPGPSQSPFVQQTPTVISRPISVPTNGAVGFAVANPFALEIAQAEKSYPQLNPKSSQYDQTIVDVVAQRMGQLRNQGFAPEVAVREAVRQIMGSSQNLTLSTALQREQAYYQAPGHSNSIADGSRDCHYKGVMTDQELLACGARPPGQ